MNYSKLLQTCARSLSALWHASSPRRTGVARSLAYALALGASLLVAGSPARALDPAAAPIPASININAADEEALAAGLSGVGPARAKAIVRYRESYGPFSSVEELTEVQGISKSTLDKNRSLITLE